jgi:hypothetical protein
MIELGRHLRGCNGAAIDSIGLIFGADSVVDLQPGDIRKEFNHSAMKNAISGDTTQKSPALGKPSSAIQRGRQLPTSSRGMFSNYSMLFDHRRGQRSQIHFN